MIYSPFNACLFLTHYCNLHCSFCSYRPFQSENDRDLSTEQWQKIIDELSELKVFQIRIPGGEPLIRRDILILLKHIAKGNMRFTLNTNGTLLTEYHADFIGSLNRADEVRISIDGLEKCHDEIRGSGNWRLAVNAVKLLKKYHVPVTVNMVVTTSNYQDCIPACRFCLDELNADKLQVNSVSDSFNEISDEQGKIPDEKYVMLMSELVELRKSYPQLSASFLDMYEQLVNPKIQPGCRRCTSPWKSVTIRSDGAILACPSAMNNVIGWSGKDSIKDVWQNSRQMADFRNQIRNGKVQDNPECLNCRYQWYCNQACPPSRPEVKHRCRKELFDLLVKIS